MGIVLFAIVSAAIAYFGGISLGMYDAYGVSAPFIGAAIGAVIGAVLASALKPRREPTYQGPAFDR